MKKMTYIQQIERSIIKTYRKSIWSPFVKAIKDFQMISEGDAICVCISGGKDSMLLAKCLQELQKYSPVTFTLKFMLADPGYHEDSLNIVLANAATLDIPLVVTQSRIFEIVQKVDGNPCYLCARMRRGHLYKEAKNLGCNKIALGHHNDDVIETSLLNMFYASEINTMMPRAKSDNYEGMELIRPLYYVKEKSIINWRDAFDLAFINCACPLNDACVTDPVEESKAFAQDLLESHMSGSRVKLPIGKRKEMKNLLKLLDTLNPEIKANIFKSFENVNLKGILGFRNDEERITFIEAFEKENND